MPGNDAKDLLDYTFARESESLRGYIKCFNAEKDWQPTTAVSRSSVLSDMVYRIDLRKSLHLKLPKSVDDLMAQAERHMIVEEEMVVFLPVQQETRSESRLSNDTRKCKMNGEQGRGDMKRGGRARSPLRFEKFTRPNSLRTAVMFYARKAGHLDTSVPMRAKVGRRD